MKTTIDSALLAMIDGIVEPENPSKPISYTIVELQRLGNIFVDEGQKFIDKGLTKQYLEQAEQIADELGKREASWSALRFNSPEDHKIWKDISEKAYDLHHLMANELLLALLDEAELTSNVHFAMKEKSWLHLGVNIRRLIEIGIQNQTIVSRTGLTPEYFVHAEEIADAYDEALRHKLSAMKTSESHKLARDRAAQVGNAYLAKIRRYADVIYVHDATTRARFNSIYSTLLNRRRNIPKDETEKVNPKV